MLVYLLAVVYGFRARGIKDHEDGVSLISFLETTEVNMFVQLLCRGHSEKAEVTVDDLLVVVLLLDEVHYFEADFAAHLFLKLLAAFLKGLVNI